MGAPQSSPTPLWCDNNSAIQIAHNDVFHERTKHIEIDCHFVRQHVVRNTIRLQSISTLDQPTDIFTKAHLPGRFRELLNKLNLSRSSPDQGTCIFVGLKPMACSSRLVMWSADSERDDPVITVEGHPEGAKHPTQHKAAEKEKLEDATSDQTLSWDSVYQLILECWRTLVNIETGIRMSRDFIRGEYLLKFPELESLVRDPIDYARVVKRIGNEVNIALVDLEGLLQPAVIVDITNATSTTSG
ncbi:hypothetical protein OSB04_018583 [Centaurea solstitialis]|uniref:NOSIC domain-containing protein n=1 Tax=Centaurea solstitialis TaxID=347529 RepID=A0AA38TCN9_9ASTR|nr:hypothetical protein OSB04_018583 [Centaurea solstitialis]